MKSSPNLGPSKNVLAARPVAHLTCHIVQRVLKYLRETLSYVSVLRRWTDQWAHLAYKINSPMLKGNNCVCVTKKMYGN